MGLRDLLNSISNTPSIEKRTQMLFKDNGNILFRQLEIADASLLEKNNGVLVKGWRHFHKLQFPFDGYKNISADMVTLSHERDIIYDPFGILSVEEKPALGVGFNRRGIKEIAQSACYKHEHQKPAATILDKLTWFLGAALMIMVIGFFIRMI